MTEIGNPVERALGFVAEFHGDRRCSLNAPHAEALASEVLRLRAGIAALEQEMGEASSLMESERLTDCVTRMLMCKRWTESLAELRDGRG